MQALSIVQEKEKSSKNWFKMPEKSNSTLHKPIAKPIKRDIQLKETKQNVLENGIKKLELPERLKEKSKLEIGRAVKFIMSDYYFETNIAKRNWTEPEYDKTLKEHLKDEKWLEKRAEEVLSKAAVKLDEFYKGKDTITIP